ncbi:MAG: transketolase C-terminal domain-containing protein [Anaerolineaceae bacterium]|nr:transketolase C-terminal domain-containing protein [Anaerolineaceae bacterium]
MEILTKIHARNLVEWAKNRPEVLVLSADLTSSTEADLFQKAYPERFFSFGLAEQNMMSAAGGLAREGFLPFIHTFAVFIYRRAYDQLVDSVAYPNLPVRMVGFLPGITTPGGITHQAIEDVAMLRAVPNMTILEVGDATEIETVLDVTLDIPGPIYLRMLRGEVPRLFAKSEPFKFNQVRELSKGKDITLFSSGICTEEAMRAMAILKQRGVSIHHMHVSTLKPFTDPAILEASSQARLGVITMENHTIVGGLGSAVAEVLADHGIGKRLKRIGLKDTFAHGASRPYLMREYELDALSLVHAVEEMVGHELDITETDLQTVRLEAVHSTAKAEAL